MSRKRDIYGWKFYNSTPLQHRIQLMMAYSLKCRREAQLKVACVLEAKKSDKFHSIDGRFCQNQLFQWKIRL